MAESMADTTETETEVTSNTEEVSTPSCPDPGTTNPLYQSGFLLTINAIPSLNFWCKELTLPDISLQEVDQETPFIKVPHPGTKVAYSQVNCTIIADSKLANYKALYDWMILMGFTKDYTQNIQFKKTVNVSPYLIMKDLDSSLESSATLVIKGTNQTKVATIMFNNMWITQLGSLTLTEESTDAAVVTFTATFNIKDFDFMDVD